jgi:hypothetical protein
MTRLLAVFGMFVVFAVGLKLLPFDLREFVASTEAAQAASGSFELQASGASGACAVTRGREIGPGLAELAVEQNCDDIYPGIEKARFWQDKADGSVVFTATGADAILTFGVADGIAYESYLPVTPLVTLASVE